MEEQAVIEQVEGALDSAVETVVPEVVETIQAFRHNPIVLAGVALVGLSVGAAIGYKVAEKKLATKFEELLDKEVAETQRYYATLTKKDYPTIEDAVEELIPEGVPEEAGRAMVNYGAFSGDVPEVVDEQTEVVVVETKEKHNIFVNGQALDKEFDYDAEVAQRSDDKPYVVTEDEYFENEGEHEQSDLTYYEGDDVLADERDQVVNDVDNIVGDDNLRKFGHGSKDRNKVYVRNMKLQADYEIVRSTGKYAVEVLGFDEDEQRHAPARRFRGSDD